MGMMRNCRFCGREAKPRPSNVLPSRVAKGIRWSIIIFAFLAALPAQAQRTASNPLGAQLNVQDAGTCSTTNSFAWQVLPANAATTTLNLSGTWTATVTVRESNNGGGTWSTAPTNGTLTTTGTTTYATNGFTDFCADVTAFTSGIVQVSIATGLQQVIPGSGSLAGTNGQLLFNNNGVFGGTSGLTWNGTQLLASNGTAANPLYSFSGATGAGLFLSGTNPVLAQNGSSILSIGNPSVFSFPVQMAGVTNGAGLQLFNTSTSCTTAATINTPCTTASITLPTGYADTNYRLSISCLGVTAFPQVQTYTKSNTTFTITLNNLTAAAATCSSFDVIATHN